MTTEQTASADEGHEMQLKALEVIWWTLSLKYYFQGQELTFMRFEHIYV